MSLLGWFLFHIPFAVAVGVDDTGYGQALIFPFYSAAIGNSSLVTIANELDPPTGLQLSPTAVKVRFLGAADGTELASFNVYLGRHDVWTAAVARSGDDTIVKSPDASCVLPKAQDGVLATLDEDIGSIEVIQMATVEDFLLAQAIDNNDCDTIESRWSDGPWSTDPGAGLIPPAGGLRGSLILIHVQKGTAYTIPATALADFSDSVQHTAPGTATPNLSTAHDADTDTGPGTKSTVCSKGECTSDYWPEPIDAVAAALTTEELHGEILTTDSIGAKTEWVVSYPTRRYRAVLPQLASFVSLSYADREGEVGLVAPCVPLPPPGFLYQCDSAYTLNHTNAVEVVSFGHSAEEFNQPAISAILGKQFIVEFPGKNGPTVPDEGTGRLGFETGLTNDSGRQYLGLPVIGNSLQEVLNSTLNGDAGQAQRANYGMVLPMSRYINIED